MKIKEFLKKTPLKTVIRKYKYAKLEHKNKPQEGVIKSFFKYCFRYKDIKINTSQNLNKAFKRLKVEKKLDDELFYYFIDEKVFLNQSEVVLGNIPIEYSLILENSLLDLIPKNDDLLIATLTNYIERIIKINDDEFIFQSFDNLLKGKALSFKDALQRILFANQLVWQTKHTLMGLGRLDKILYPYYKEDLQKGVINKEEALTYIKSFLKQLHNHYNYKSNTIIGDTGQIIILGGLEKDGSYFCNDLTYIFIEEIEKLELPDPKTLLRVSSKMPKELLSLAIKSMSTGIGCPLLANDDVIIPYLKKSGYESIDCYNYGTSACWEPTIIGKSIDQNNADSLNLPALINSIVEENETIANFNELKLLLKQKIKDKISEMVSLINNIKYSEDPILSLFLLKDQKLNTYNLFETTKYKTHGILCPGFSNSINSLINIDNIVYKKNEISLKDFNKMRKSNFIDCYKLSTSPFYYGDDDEYVISLTNEIISYINDACKENKTKYGHNIKAGLSAPSYISIGTESEASFDFRKNNEPYNVHISSTNHKAYTELVNFASKLKYLDYVVNGNVIDFMVGNNFIKDNFVKFTNFINLSIKNGFYEMQLNVVSAQTLKNAKQHPEDYKNLIVRVWGFSAYFNDLPEIYKDYLIMRAERNEN